MKSGQPMGPRGKSTFRAQPGRGRLSAAGALVAVTISLMQLAALVVVAAATVTPAMASARDEGAFGPLESGLLGPPAHASGIKIPRAAWTTAGTKQAVAGTIGVAEATGGAVVPPVKREKPMTPAPAAEPVQPPEAVAPAAAPEPAPQSSDRSDKSSKGEKDAVRTGAKSGERTAPMPPDAGGIFAPIQDWLAKANREYQGTIVKQLSRPSPEEVEAAAEKQREEEKSAELKRKAEEQARTEAAAKAETAKKAEERAHAEVAAKAEAMKRAEEAKKADAAKQQSEAQKKAEAEAAHKAEAQKKAEAEAARKAEAQKADAQKVEAQKAEAQKADKEAEAARKAAAETEAAKQAAAKQAETDARRLAEEDKKAAEEAKNAAEAEKLKQAARVAEQEKARQDKARQEAERQAKQAEEAQRLDGERLAAEKAAAEKAAREAQQAEQAQPPGVPQPPQQKAQVRARPGPGEHPRDVPAFGDVARSTQATSDKAGRHRHWTVTIDTEPITRPAAGTRVASDDGVMFASRRLRPTMRLGGNIANGTAVKRWMMRTRYCRAAGRKVRLPGRYTVAKGDTLWEIAETHYDNGAKYPRIYRANRGRIADPDLIYPCQRFLVPRKKRH